ncbi:hypothetical protein LDG_5417 [Legionella drancourtii LLAP12]|uniref:Uncharacterized protein n=1 Tax=Legionella drancourtii LLAP12 TaxID=658187 RepID=G9EJQ1_9GAMM|nr:hypothetical protein LDG_5417 [Legionella drancourtii LLAP12]
MSSRKNKNELYPAYELNTNFKKINAAGAKQLRASTRSRACFSAVRQHNKI